METRVSDVVVENDGVAEALDHLQAALELLTQAYDKTLAASGAHWNGREAFRDLRQVVFRAETEVNRTIMSMRGLSA